MKFAWILWDIFAVFVLVQTVGRCAAKGFIRTAISFAGYLIASALAWGLSPAAAKLLYDQVVGDILEMVVTKQMDSLLTEGAANGASILDAIPKNLQGIVQQSGGELVDSLFGGDTAAMARSLVEGALRDPVMTILQGICFFVLFWLALFVVKHFSKLFTGLYRIPILGTVNTVLGGVIGMLEGALMLYLLAVLLQLVVTVSGGGWPWLNMQVFDDTYIYRVFFKF